MGADELKARAIALAKPPEDSSAPPEPTGLIDRGNWDRFTLFAAFRRLYPDIPFFRRPVEEWTGVELRDFLQWAIAVDYGREYVGEIMVMWEKLRVDQNELMDRLVAARRLG